MYIYMYIEREKSKLDLKRNINIIFSSIDVIFI